MSLDLCLTLDESGLRPFRAAFEAAQLSGQAQPTDRLLAAAREHSRELPRDQVPPALLGHLDTFAELADFVADEGWAGDSEARRAAMGALAYFVDPSDLIPDENPQFGLLDDAIVLQLALTACRHEWESWREYAAFKRAYPQFAGIDREAWMDLRREELNQVLRHRRRSAARGSTSYRTDTPLREFVLN